MAGVDWGGLSVFITALTGLVGTIGALWIQSKKIANDRGPTGKPRHSAADDDPPPVHPMTVEQIVDIVEERDRRRGRPGLEMRLRSWTRARMIA